MAIDPKLIYEKTLSDGLCDFDTIRIDEFDNTIYDTGYTYSGITLVLDYTNFTSHFDTTGHTYENIILNNNVYAYTGITGETHYFEIYDFYSGATLYIDPLLSGMTESEVITGFTMTTGCTAQLSPLTGVCCPTEAVLSNLPWVFTTNHGAGDDDCDDFVARRTEEGFTLDYVFNRNDLPFSSGGKFFYTGVRDEYDPENYVDNNLSFGFTDDGRISWQSVRYSGYCDTVSGYTPIHYISSGQTPVLCTNGVSEDFNVTISFERYYQYSGCSLANEGGWNDMVVDNSTIEMNEYLPSQIEELNNHWRRERWKRLGSLKIYYNGKVIYRLPERNMTSLQIDHSTDWEEIILSDRGDQPFVQSVGGGVTGSGGIHEGVCCFDIKYTSYFETPLDFQYIQNRYLNVTKPTFNIVECNDACADGLVPIESFFFDGILTEDLIHYLLTSDQFYIKL